MSGGLARRFTSFQNNPTGMQLLKRVQLTGAATSIDTGTFTARNALQIYWFSAGKSAAESTLFRVNGSSGAIYSQFHVDNGVLGSLTAQTAWTMEAAATQFVSGGSLFMPNIDKGGKKPNGITTSAGTPAAAPSQRIMSGHWGTAGADTAQVTQITLLTSGGGTFSVGSYIEVYGGSA